MHWLKLGLCLALSGFILIFLKTISTRPACAKPCLARAIIGGMALRIAGAVAIYSFWPHLNYSSDPVRVYIVQVRRLLAGMVPYRDYPSSYSFFFGPALAMPVSVWDSVGAIALFMSALEVAAMWLYLRREGNDPDERDLLTVFFWVWLPNHFYWLSLAGYNSGMIAAGVMASVVLAHRKRDVAAGIISGLTFLTTKLLALLFWPAVVLRDFDRMAVWRRAAPHFAAMLALAGIAMAGADPILPVKLEFGRWTSGTVWFFWWMFGEGVRKNAISIYGPIVVFFSIFILLLKKYREHVSKDGASFDASAAFIGCTGLLFMLVSRKAYSFYLPMFLPFVMHVVASQMKKLSCLLPLLYLGAVTTIEPYLWVHIRSEASPWSDWRSWLLAAVDTGVIASYFLLARRCWKHLDCAYEATKMCESSAAAGKTARLA